MMNRLQNIAVVLLAAILCVVVFQACERAEMKQEKAITGLIDATEIDIASKIPGRVKEMAVREGDRVEKGQKLLTLSSDEIEAKIAQVNAGIDASKAQLDMARS